MPAAPVYLTFDDGPWPGGTPAVLDVLRALRVRATFFVIGRHARRWPDLVRRIAGEGHAVGNHSFDHPYLGWARSGGYWREQVERTDAAVERAGVARPGAFRPPMGVATRAVRGAAEAAGKRWVMWDRRAVDGTWTTAGAIGRRLRGAGAGEVLLLHDGASPGLGWVRRVGATLAALPAVVREGRARGLDFATL